MKRTKQKGIVLLTVMVFLLMILGVLRYSMTSANIQEKKSGVDYDEFVAYQQAELAIREAERFIMQAGIYKVEKASGSSAGCVQNGTQNGIQNGSVGGGPQCTEQQWQEIEAAATELWNPKKTVADFDKDTGKNYSNYFTSGALVTPIDPNNPPSDIPQALEDPFNGRCTIDTFNTAEAIAFGTETKTNLKGFGHVADKPYYMIARYNLEQINQSNDEADKDVVILKVCALGYGLKGPNPTKTVLEATYAFGGSE